MVKLTLTFRSEVTQDQQKRIIEMYERGEITFEPGYLMDKDGNVLEILEISAVPVLAKNKWIYNPVTKELKDLE